MRRVTKRNPRGCNKKNGKLQLALKAGRILCILRIRNSACSAWLGDVEHRANVFVSEKGRKSKKGHNNWEEGL